MKDLEKTLIKNGLTYNEAKIYLTALETGEIPLSRLAEKTGIKRATLYLALTELKAKKILTLSKKRGIQYASVIDPTLLIEMLQNKISDEMNELKEKSKQNLEILENLKTLKEASPFRPRVQFFDGREGIKQILRNFSKSTEQSMGFTDYELMPDELLEFIREEIIPERKKNKNHAKFLVSQNKKNEEVKKRDSLNYAEHKILSFREANNPIELLLFDNDKVAFVSFKREEQFGIILESEAIYKTLKNIFYLNWDAI